MTGIILAGALGALALVVALLFRQLRQLSWQLTVLRVERDSERILREIGIRPGSGSGVTEPLEDPVRRKHHLALHIGGGLAAALMKMRHLRRTSALVASSAAATIVLGAATLLLITTQAPHSRPPTIPPTGEVSSVSSRPEPHTPGSTRSSSPSGHSRARGGALPEVSQITDDGVDLAMGKIGNAPPAATESAGTPPSRSSPSRGSPPAPPTSPLAPSVPAPSAAATASPLLCVDLRVLLELGLCVNG